jgi:hypothetical protein
MVYFGERHMIEISPREYWIRCTYDEAVLYCFQLEIDGKVGWRIFKDREEEQILPQDTSKFGHGTSNDYFLLGYPIICNYTGIAVGMICMEGRVYSIWHDIGEVNTNNSKLLIPVRDR